MKTHKKITVSVLSVLVILGCAIVPIHAQEDKSVAVVVKSDVNVMDDIDEPIDKVNNTALMKAARIGDKLVIKSLLSQKANPNLQNNAGATALMIAAKYGHAHVVDLLLEYGADPLIKNNRGHRASLFALGYQHYDLHRSLLAVERGAQKNK